jgi:hypothetical protein
MLSMRSRFVLSLMVFSAALLPATMRGQTAQAPEPPAGVAPAPMTQAPSTKVDVIFVNGQLTIKANKAPLFEVLHSACTKIGAELDAQTEPTEPISGTLGPGSPKDVLDQLLADAHVNYALGGTTEDPNVVAKVTIFPRSEEHVASNEASPEQTVQKPDNSASAARVRSASSQMMELIEAAKPELASGSVTLDQNLAEGSDGGKQADMAAIVQQIESYLKNAGQSASNTDAPQNQQTGSGNSDSSGVQSNVVNPTHRPMHRKHH